jgi:hypothetical protein
MKEALMVLALALAPVDGSGFRPFNKRSLGPKRHGAQGMRMIDGTLMPKDSIPLSSSGRNYRLSQSSRDFRIWRIGVISGALTECRLSTLSCLS